LTLLEFSFSEDLALCALLLNDGNILLLFFNFKLFKSSFNCIFSLFFKSIMSFYFKLSSFIVCYLALSSDIVLEFNLLKFSLCLFFNSIFNELIIYLCLRDFFIQIGNYFVLFEIILF
jgi:hypothetical protein